MLTCPESKITAFYQHCYKASQFIGLSSFEWIYVWKCSKKRKIFAEVLSTKPSENYYVMYGNV